MILPNISPCLSLFVLKYDDSLPISCVLSKSKCKKLRLFFPENKMNYNKKIEYS